VERKGESSPWVPRPWGWLEGWVEHNHRKGWEWSRGVWSWGGRETGGEEGGRGGWVWILRPGVA